MHTSSRLAWLGGLAALLCVSAVQAQSNPRSIKRLNDSDDPLLALTGPIARVSGEAAAGSAPPSADPRDFEGVWWISR